MVVLMAMLGGVGSFTSGGPGEGLCSRVYLNVLTRHTWLDNFSAVGLPFEDRCLMGVYAAGPPEYADDAVAVMIEELQSLATNVAEGEVERAKTVAIGNFLMSLEAKTVVAEDIGKQILMLGRRRVHGPL